MGLNFGGEFERELSRTEAEKESERTFVEQTAKIDTEKDWPEFDVVGHRGGIWSTIGGGVGDDNDGCKDYGGWGETDLFLRFLS